MLKKLAFRGVKALAIVALATGAGFALTGSVGCSDSSAKCGSASQDKCGRACSKSECASSCEKCACGAKTKDACAKECNKK